MAAADNCLAGKDGTRRCSTPARCAASTASPDLVHGFRALEDPDARLVVYGGGDFAPELTRPRPKTHASSSGAPRRRETVLAGGGEGVAAGQPAAG